MEEEEEEVSSGEEKVSSSEEEVGVPRNGKDGPQNVTGDTAKNAKRHAEAVIQKEISRNAHPAAGENSGQARSNSAMRPPTKKKVSTSPNEESRKKLPDVKNNPKMHTLARRDATSPRKSPRQSPQKPPATRRATDAHLSRTQGLKRTEVGRKDDGTAHGDVGVGDSNEEGGDRQMLSELETLEDDIFGPERTSGTGEPTTRSESKLKKRKRYPQSRASKQITLRPRKQQK